MAINYDRENNDFSHIGVPFNYTRGNPLPLDNSSVWTSFNAASAYALSSPVAYVGQIITVSSDSTFDAYIIENSIGSLRKLASGGDASELARKINEVSGVVDSISVGLSTAIDTVAGDVSTLRNEVSAISGNHETRIVTVEGKVAKLSSAMHFKGVNTSYELSTGSTAVPIPPYKEGEAPEAGDIVIVKDSKEFIWALSSADDSKSGMWYELGAEGVWASKSALEAEVTRAQAAEDVLSGKIDNKVKVGNYGSALQNQEQLSVVKIADEDYYKLVSEGKVNNDIVYIVSSDYVNGHDQRIINVGNAISATDAVNLSGMNAAIDQAKSEIVANALSGVQINNDISAEVVNNIAILSIEIINCGSAN